MIMKHCLKNGCHELITAEESYCIKHKKQSEFEAEIKRQKEKKLESISTGYKLSRDRHTRYMHSTRANEIDVEWYQSAKWKRLSQQIHISDLYMCQICGHSQLPNESMVTDHIVPRRTEPELSMTLSNLWLLCRQCHNAKSAEERKRTPEQLKAMTRNDWKRLLR